MTVELSELSMHLGDFIKKVQQGESVLIRQEGETVAELRPPSERPPRPFGLYKGEFEVTEAFFDPLPDDILDTIYEKDLFPSDKPASSE